MMNNLNALTNDASWIGKELNFEGKKYTVAKIDNFEYTDPIDGAVAKKQVINRCFFY